MALFLGFAYNSQNNDNSPVSVSDRVAAHLSYCRGPDPSCSRLPYFDIAVVLFPTVCFYGMKRCISGILFPTFQWMLRDGILLYQTFVVIFNAGHVNWILTSLMCYGV